MTKKDFFRLIIKILGLYSLITTIFSFFPNNLKILFRINDTLEILLILLNLIILLSLFWFIINNTDKVINWFKLDRGYDDEIIDLNNFNNASILKLSVIIIGGLLLIQNIPLFIAFTIFNYRAIFSHNVDMNMIIRSEMLGYMKWTIYLINIIIGYLMIRYNDSIPRLIKERGNKDNTVTQDLDIS